MYTKIPCGRIFAVTLAAVTGACTVAVVIHHLLRDLITYCNTYNTPRANAPLAFDEIEERSELPDPPEPTRPSPI